MSIDFATLQGLTIPEGVVTQIADAAGNVLWSAVGWPDDLDTGLEFISASAFTITVATPKWDGTMEYCNGKGWKTWDGSAISSSETESGQCIYIRGTGNTKVTDTNYSDSYRWTLTGTGIKCNGNIEKLLDYATAKVGEHPTMAQHCYRYMFSRCTGLTSAPSLPATTLADYCYNNMFSGCTGLTTAPSLPATTLAEACYEYMFRGCTGLTTAPSLPATTLAKYCYARMFYGCTALTTAPALPVTTLAYGCYRYMFYGCTGLTSVPSLPATTLTTYCYEYMFRGCTGLTTAPSLPATTLADYCYDSMFYGCTGLTSVPSLPATTLALQCYRNMFNRCTRIKLSSTKTGTYTKAYRIPYSGTGTTATNALAYMFSGTGGTFTDEPTINTTYYLDSSNTIV